MITRTKKNGVGDIETGEKSCTVEPPISALLMFGISHNQKENHKQKYKFEKFSTR